MKTLTARAIRATSAVALTIGLAAGAGAAQAAAATPAQGASGGDGAFAAQPAKVGLGSGSTTAKATKYCTGIEGKKGLSASKVIEARAKTTSTGYVYLCKKSGDRYVLDKGPYRAKFGVNGVTASKKEGDGKTPSGVFWMRDGFGTSGNPGLQKPYTKVTSDYVWVDGKATKAQGYNTMQRKSKGYKGEELYQPKPYKNAQVIGYNEARTPGKGSAIFLHANTASMKTAGCVSLYQSSLVKVMKWEGKTKTQIVIH